VLRHSVQRERLMNYVFWLIGVIVVILVVLGFLGLR
jgi:predicted nucleic acid-binding Zn ribbon protein